MKKAGAFGGILLILGLAAGCNFTQIGAGGSGPGPAVKPPPAVETLAFTVLPFPDATIDLAITVVDSATLATIYSSSVTGQSTPCSDTCSYVPGPARVTVTVKFNLLSSGAIHVGTNITPGTPTVTVAVPTFYATQFKLPLFVVNAVPGPSELVDVTSVSSQSTLDLSAGFASTPYLLFQTRQLSVRIDHTYVGTETRLAAFPDNTTATQQFTTEF